MIYLAIFSLLILIFLWLFQIVLLNTHYKIEKTTILKSSMEKLEKHYNQKDLEEVYASISLNEGICIDLIQDNNVLYSSSSYNNKCISRKNSVLTNFKNSFILSGKKTSSLEITNPTYNNLTLVYAKKLDNHTYLFLDTSLVPLDNSIQILKKQFLIVAIIVFLIAIFISYFISQRLSKPIVELSKGVKKLGKKDYSVRFKTNSDILEIDELSNTLNEAVLELSKTDHLRRDLMANVGHDLKTPLTMIMAYAEAIRDLDYSKEKEIANLNIIIEEVNRLNILVNDIIDLSKLESGIITMEPKELHLTEFTKNILKRFEILEEEGYQFLLKPIKKDTIYADPKRMEQVFYNLIYNAIHYTGEDKKVEIVFKENQKTNSIHIQIIDTGKGISKKDQELIWDKYYQASKNHHRNKHGSGLGLSIVKNILELHQYSYGVTSSKKGTIFYFDVPKMKKAKKKISKEKNK